MDAPDSAPSLSTTRPEIASPDPPPRGDSPERLRSPLVTPLFAPDPAPEELDDPEFEPAPEEFPPGEPFPPGPIPGWTGFWPNASAPNTSTVMQFLGSIRPSPLGRDYTALRNTLSAPVRFRFKGDAQFLRWPGMNFQPETLGLVVFTVVAAAMAAIVLRALRSRRHPGFGEAD